MLIINPLELAKEAAEKKKKEQQKKSSSSKKTSSSSSSKKTTVSNLSKNKGPVRSTYKEKSTAQKYREDVVSSLKKSAEKNAPNLPNSAKEAVKTSAQIFTALNPVLPTSAKSYLKESISSGVDKAAESAKKNDWRKQADKENPLSFFDKTLDVESQDIIRQAKQDWMEAEKSRGKVDDTLIDKVQEEAHRLAELVRAEKGYSGGSSGNKIIFPELSEGEEAYMTPEAKQMLRMQKQIYEISAQRGDEAGMQMAQETADAIRLSQSSWDVQKIRDDKENTKVDRGVDAHGRSLPEMSLLDAEA